MVDMIMSLIGFSWAIIPLYFLFGSDNLWLVLTIIIIIATIIHLAKLDWIVEEVDKQIDIKPDPYPYFYINNHDHCDCNHGEGSDD